MANFNGTARSNYFIVKDEAAFRAWCEGLNLSVFEGEGIHTGRLGFCSYDPDTGCFPSFRDDDKGFDGPDEVDLAGELATHTLPTVRSPC